MVTKIILIGWTVFIAWSFITGVANVAHDPTLVGHDTAIAIGFTVSIIIHWLVWMVVCVPTYIISNVFRRQDNAPPRRTGWLRGQS